MRRMFSVGLAAALALCVAGTASAATTIDLKFGGIGGPTVTTSLAAPATVTMSVFMTTTDGLEAFSTTIFWNNSDISAIAGTVKWSGILVPGFDSVFAPAMAGPAGTFITFIDNPNKRVFSFDGIQLGSAIPAGTYQLGTIVWLASAAGTTTFTSGIIDGLDGFIGCCGSHIINGTVTFNGATMNVVPEPGTASLLGLGLVGLILAGRRKRA